MRYLKGLRPTSVLRDYQAQSAISIDNAFHCVRRVLYVLPTAAGKTHVAVHFIIGARRRGERVLFLAHRRELINQAVQRLIATGVPATSIGVMMGRDPRANPDAPVQVASIDTLRRRDFVHADFIVVDEAHRAMGKCYSRMLAMYPEARVLGLTATPFRLDGKGLGREFEVLVVGKLPEDLVSDGWLAPCRVFTVPDELMPALKEVRTVAGDYDLQQLGLVMNRRPLVANVVQEYARIGEDRAAVVFASTLEHARAICDEFGQAGYAAEYLDGNTPLHERDAMLARLRDGATRVLVNCDVLVEGWDAPWVKCAILARPTRSVGRYLQMAGRIMRPWDGVDALVLDHAGNAIQHGLPHMDRTALFTLVDRKKRKGHGRPFAKRCPQCGRTVGTGTRICPECDFEWVVEEVPDTIEGELHEAKPKVCSECGKATKGSRKAKTDMCMSCVARKRNAALTPEQRRERSERARKRMMAMTPEQRSERARKSAMAMTPEQRSERARKAGNGNNAMTPEQRSKVKRMMWATKELWERSEIAHKRNATITSEQWSERMRKAWETRRAKKQAEELAVEEP